MDLLFSAITDDDFREATSEAAKWAERTRSKVTALQAELDNWQETAATAARRLAKALQTYHPDAASLTPAQVVSWALVRDEGGEVTGVSVELRAS